MLTFLRFPLSKYLVGIENDIATPLYRQQQPLVNLNSLSGTLNENYLDTGIHCQDKSLNNINVVETWPIIAGATLDESQLAATQRILSKAIAIIQGPPGTGKTFVSVSAIKVLLDNWAPGDAPIVVAAQTNHALDQLLMLIARSEPRCFVRLGGRTSKENKEIRERSLYNVCATAKRSSHDGFGSIGNARKALKAQGEIMAHDLEPLVNCKGPFSAELLLKYGVITQPQYDSLQTNDDWVVSSDSDLPSDAITTWLGQEHLEAASPGCPPINMGFMEEELDFDFEQLQEREGETTTNEEDEMVSLSGLWVPICEVYNGVADCGFNEVRVQRLLAEHTDLWKLPSRSRGSVYRYFQRLLKKAILAAFIAHGTDYTRLTRSRKVGKWGMEAKTIRNEGIKLIGCTTTGLSKYRGLLAAVSPRILLVEEAAETLEGTVLAAMFESLEHLILVGDHLQVSRYINGYLT